MKRSEFLLRIQFAQTPGLGSRSFQQIILKYKTLEEFIHAYKAGDLTGKSKAVAEKFLDYGNDFDTKEFVSKIKDQGIGILALGEEDYPEMLSQIYAPPIVLYYLGNFDKKIFKNCISFVGTRRCTSYGKMVTAKLVGELSSRGFTIVSGLAFGIDSQAHVQAIKSDAITIAVIAGAIDEASPGGNKLLYENIKSHGLVLSENPPGYKIQKGDFPRRNRIIAGLSRAVVVTEAGKKSGALITAHFAFDEDRLVFAVPGDITKFSSQGPNNLIKTQRAKLVDTAEDIIVEFGFSLGGEVVDRVIDLKLSSQEKELFEKLKEGPLSEDQIIAEFDISTSNLLASLAQLELKGLITRISGNKFSVVL